MLRNPEHKQRLKKQVTTSGMRLRWQVLILSHSCDH